jgi:hypothetical protein
VEAVEEIGVFVLQFVKDRPDRERFPIRVERRSFSFEAEEGSEGRDDDRISLPNRVFELVC